MELARYKQNVEEFSVIFKGPSTKLTLGYFKKKQCNSILSILGPKSIISRIIVTHCLSQTKRVNAIHLYLILNKPKGFRFVYTEQHF